MIELSIHELSDLYARRELSPVEVTKAYLDRIEAVNPKINAYITLMPETALKQAQKAEEMLAAGQAGPMTGIPLAVKDVLCTQGVPTTCGSNILKNYIPPYDAFIIDRLRRAGTVFLGKTNMDEFAMGSSNEHSAFGPVQQSLGYGRIFPGAPAAGRRRPRPRPACAPVHWAPTPAAPSASPPATAVWSASNPPTDGSPGIGLVAFASSLDQAGPHLQEHYRLRHAAPNRGRPYDSGGFHFGPGTCIRLPGRALTERP